MGENVNNKTAGSVKKKQKNGRLKRTLKAIFLTMVFLCVAFLLFGVVYVLQIDAFMEFDPERITGAPQALLVYDANGEQISTLASGHTRIYVPFDEIPKHVVYALISAEDARFYEHVGIDVIRIAGAAWEDIKAGSYEQGGSTITQQLIKLSHLSEVKLMSRKIEEAVLAYQMERQFSKDEILEMYLNYVYFGGGYSGIEAAARGYFGVSAKDLTLAQGAMLVGTLKSPSRYAPHLNMEASTGRRNLVLRLMRDYGYIDDAALKEAQSEPVTLDNNLNSENRGYYIDLALTQACDTLNITMGELLSGGYKLYTSMDTELQSYLEETMLDDSLFPENAGNIQAALVVINVKTGGVAALMGGRESTTALGYNRATQIRRQPGSVIKPIIAYAPALEYNGYTTVSMVLDEPTDFNGYQPSNFSERYRGWVTLRDAVSNSLNIPAVKVLNDIGIDGGKEFASKLGIEFDETDDSLTLALGGFTYGVSPFQIAGAYAAFARGGVYSSPALISRIECKDGSTVYSYEPENERVMSESNSYILTDMLKTAIEQGTGRRLGEISIPLAGKTGTTGVGKENRDAWMAAYNPEYAAAVWMGYDNSASGQALPSEVTGGTYPAMILSRVFSKLYEGGEAPDFIMPDDVVEVKLDNKTLEATHSAVLASAFTPTSSVKREVFKKGTEPVSVSTYWSVPSAPNTFYAELDEAKHPRITFLPEEDYIIYRLYREDIYGEIQLLGEWAGSGGAVRYTDYAAKESSVYYYYVIPVHPELEIGGSRVVGPSTRKLAIYVPVTTSAYGANEYDSRGYQTYGDDRAGQYAP